MNVAITPVRFPRADNSSLASQMGRIKRPILLGMIKSGTHLLEIFHFWLANLPAWRSGATDTVRSNLPHHSPVSHQPYIRSQYSASGCFLLLPWVFLSSIWRSSAFCARRSVWLAPNPSSDAMKCPLVTIPSGSVKLLGCIFRFGLAFSVRLRAASSLFLLCLAPAPCVSHLEQLSPIFVVFTFEELIA